MSLPVRDVARRALACRLAGLAAGAAAGLALLTTPGSWLGLGPALAAPVFAICLLGGVLLGESIAVGRPPAVRTAVLEVREVRQYPYYALPIGLTVLTGALVAGAALRRLTRRPRPGSGAAGDRPADDRARRASARAVTAAVGVLAAAPLAGTAVIASGRLRSLGCAPASLGWGTLALGAVAAVATGAFAAALLVSDRR